MSLKHICVSAWHARLDYLQVSYSSEGNDQPEIKSTYSIFVYLLVIFGYGLKMKNMICYKFSHLTTKIRNSPRYFYVTVLRRQNRACAFHKSNNVTTSTHVVELGIVFGRRDC